MPFADIEKRRKASRDSNRKRRARDRAALAAKLPAPPSSVDSLAAFIEGLTIAQGERAGQRFQLLPWERQFLVGAFADDVDTAALSIARANGTTSLCAAIAAAAVVGPLAVQRGEVVAVASSLQQARLIFAYALDYLKPWRDAEPERWRVWDGVAAARIEDRQTGAALRCIGSDARRAHGLAPRLILADEPSQWPVNNSAKMFAALETAKGKIPDARLVALGTRPASGAGWFGRLLEGGQVGVYAQVHAAPADAAIGAPETWETANPSLPHFPALHAALERESARALADASLLPQFRSLRLNQGVADTESATLIEAGTWETVEADTLPPMSGPLILGVDLGGGAALTAAAAYWPDAGRLEAMAWFPSIPSLAERGLRDGVAGLYIDLQQRGELLTTAGRTVPIAEALRWALESWGRPAVVVGDRYKQSELEQALDDAGLSVPVSWRGQGFRDGSEDVRAFRRAVLDGKVTAPPSLLIRSALSEAVTVSDASGNQKLSKGSEGGRRLRARDDVAAAMILAVAEGRRRAPRPRRPLRWAVV